MRAYQAHPAITRDVMITEARAHREADRLVSGTYWNDDGRGCAVGCSIETVIHRTGERLSHGNHELLAQRLGIPSQLAYLQDSLFEGLRGDEQQAWPERFYTAIQTGADLSGVADRFLARTLREVVLPTVAPDEDAVRAIVERIATGLETQWAQDDRAAAGAAARAAAWDAARAAAGAAAGAAAYRTMADILCAEMAVAPVPQAEAR